MKKGMWCSLLALILLPGLEINAVAGVNVIQKAPEPARQEGKSPADEKVAKKPSGPEVTEVGKPGKPLEKDAAIAPPPGGEFGPGRARDVVKAVVSRYGYDVDWSDIQAKEDESGRVYKFGFPVRVPGTSIEDDLRMLSKSTGQRVKFVFDVWENSIVHVTVQE